MTKLRIATAMAPNASATYNGRNHYIVDGPLRVGRLYRESGDALCKPRAKFSKLLDTHDEHIDATCAECLDIAARLLATGDVVISLRDHEIETAIWAGISPHLAAMDDDSIRNDVETSIGHVLKQFGVSSVVGVWLKDGVVKVGDVSNNPDLCWNKIAA